MREVKQLTKELITTHKDMAGYLPIGRIIKETIEGCVPDMDRLPFLALIADLLREKFYKRFGYLEIGVGYGASLCAVSYHQRKAEIEKYVGIDPFEHSHKPFIGECPVMLSMDVADRNARYFGPGTKHPFALFRGLAEDPAIRKRALHYLRHEIQLLYIDGSKDAAPLMADFEMYSRDVVPGGVVIFNAYHDNTYPQVTSVVDDLTETLTGWNVIGGLAPNVPTMFVMQKDEKHAD